MLVEGILVNDLDAYEVAVVDVGVVKVDVGHFEGAVGVDDGVDNDV